MMLIGRIPAAPIGAMSWWGLYNFNIQFRV
jgi:hypothetical protein